MRIHAWVIPVRVCVSQGSEAGQRDAGRWRPHQDSRLWHVQREHVRWNYHKNLLWHTGLHRSGGVFTCCDTVDAALPFWGFFLNLPTTPLCVIDHRLSALWEVCGLVGLWGSALWNARWTGVYPNHRSYSIDRGNKQTMMTHICAHAAAFRRGRRRRAVPVDHGASRLLP